MEGSFKATEEAFLNSTLQNATTNDSQELDTGGATSIGNNFINFSYYIILF